MNGTARDADDGNVPVRSGEALGRSRHQLLGGGRSGNVSVKVVPRPTPSL
jgi:hypothetical protein